MSDFAFNLVYKHNNDFLTLQKNITEIVKTYKIGTKGRKKGL